MGQRGSQRLALFFPALRWPFLLFLGLFLVVMFAFFSGAVLVAFQRLGLPPGVALTMFVFALVGSFINIPIAEERAYEPVIKLREVRFFGFFYPVPYFEVEERRMIISINVGGALVPLSIVLYELIRITMLGQYGLLFNTLLAVLIAALICNAVSIPVRGVGIAMPSIVPPLVAVLLGWLLGDGNPTLVAYISGTLGALLGADIMNWRKLKYLGAPMVSIGGAGTFDGVFLAGVIAVLLV
ncbi:DUF1614 domain-containing protein [Thermococcus stetteri]|uniref:DUF1614 domain-containing protein n=1 Tax=Thermococcus stetteri TaxID=49900 RepID=UPI001AE22E6D|nr:DUF1614 domain-containing protein [Thermococcus stetteri]MBP1911200.1 putative membrane protein [Thermococcus stetteri]